MFGPGFFATILGPLICSECKSALVLKPDKKPPVEVLHDQYARDQAGVLLEDQPLECKWAGAHFEPPVIELKQITPP